MKHRLHLPEKERSARSILTRLIHDEPFVVGSLVEMARTCGKATCKCKRGDKHLSWYLALRYKGKRKMICIPKHMEEEVFYWINTYKQITTKMDIISQSCVERIALSRKRTKE